MKIVAVINDLCILVHTIMVCIVILIYTHTHCRLLGIHTKNISVISENRKSVMLVS